MTHDPATCTCATGKRRLIVLSPNLDIEFPELLMFGNQTNWCYHQDIHALEIPFGIEEPTKSLAGFVNFLRGLLDQARLRSLRAAWLNERETIEKQFPKLIHAGSLVSMVPHDGSSLVSILHQRRIETWFQPVKRVSDGSTWGYECLLRGRADNGDLISPGALIEWAKRENLVFMLDRLSREIHLKNAGTKIPNLQSMHILINFLPSSIYRPEFCLRSTNAAAEAAGIRPENVVFEVVETEAVDDITHLTKVLAHYRHVGYKVALDDIGSGFSSLNRLAELNPDLIKIDLELIQRSRESSLHRDICKALVELGHKRNLLVLAEGIESEQDEQFAASIGADLLQGFYIGKPSPEV